MSVRLILSRLCALAVAGAFAGCVVLPAFGDGPDTPVESPPAAGAVAAEDPPAEQQPDEDLLAVQARIKSLTEAFNQHDAAAVAAHWTEQGEFITPSDVELKGRVAIEKAYQEYFANNKEVKLELAEPLLEKHAPSVVSEQGTAVVMQPDAEPVVTDYVAVHVKTPEGWRIDSIRESEVEFQHSNYENLQSLEWLIGSWASSEEGSTVTADYRWTKNENFIVNQFKVFVQDVVSLEGTQVIGWDAAAGCIRSWTFDSEGGFGVGHWEPEKDGWKIRTLQVLSDGSRASSIQLYELMDEDTVRFRSVAREVDGEILPNVGPIRVSRQ